MIIEILKNGTWYNLTALALHGAALCLSTITVMLYDDYKTKTARFVKFHSAVDCFLHVIYIGSILGWIHAGLSEQIDILYDLGFVVFEWSVAIFSIIYKVVFIKNRKNIFSRIKG